MNLADQIEETADRAVAELVAARSEHARRTRPNEPEAPDEREDGPVSDAEDE